jgi:hypothetical protein
MPEVKLAVGIFIFGVTIFLILIRKISYLEGILFLTPFRAINIDIGLSISMSEILTIIGVMFVILFQDHYILKIPKSIVPYILYCILSTIIISLFFIEFIHVNEGNFLREKGRFIAQIIFNTIPVFGLMFLLSSGLRTKVQFLSAFKILLLSILFLSLLGILQFIIFYISKIDIFPIGINADGQIRTASMGLFAGILGWLRICSFGGEPKGLAAIVTVGALIILTLNKFNIKFFNFNSLILPFFFLIILLTLSTGGIVLTIVISFLVLILAWFIRGIEWRILFKPYFFSVLALVILLFIKLKENIIEILEIRVVNRIVSEEEGIEDMDQTIISFLQDNPLWSIFGSGWGNIHNLAYKYIPTEYAWYLKDTIFVAKSGYLKIISESGFIGFILLLFFEISLIYKIFKKRSWDNWYKAFLILIPLSFLVFLVRSNYVIYEYIIIHGFALAYLKINERHKQL